MTEPLPDIKADSCGSSYLLSAPSEEDLDLDHSQWEDIHVVTGALKMFFRELPEPLFPFKFFQSFVDAVSM